MEEKKPVIITTVKRGDNFLGRVVQVDRGRFTAEVLVNGKVVVSEEITTDEDEAEFKMQNLMDETYRNMQKKHPLASGVKKDAD